MSKGFDSSSKPELSALQGARMLAALEAAKTAAAHVSHEQCSANAALRRQQAELEAVQEAGQKAGERGRDVRNSLQLLRESVDRAKLSALNAGLEGARLGDPAGKALVVMGDEVRNLLARAADALDEHTALLLEVDGDRERAHLDLVRVNDSTRLNSSAFGRAAEQSQLTCALLAELSTDMGGVFGTNAAAGRLLAEAADQVQIMADSLQNLRQRAPLGVPELRELLAPLLALVPHEEDPTR
ncbi:MAG: methyl-accepting chemotaxis protein [Pseudomonadota bacterium]